MKPMPSAMLLPNALIRPFGETRLAENADYTLGAFSFPFYLLRKAFFTVHLSGWSHEFIATVAFLADQNFAFGVTTFLTGCRLGKNGLLVGTGA
jgi:hypothetical protein